MCCFDLQGWEPVLVRAREDLIKQRADVLFAVVQIPASCTQTKSYNTPGTICVSGR